LLRRLALKKVHASGFETPGREVERGHDGK
jgi:hypothetical protein